MQFKKIFVVVADSVGIGALPDAHFYHDSGANTVGHIYEKIENFSLPTLERLGIGQILKHDRIPVLNPMALVTKMQEASIGKDTLTGHFEIMGLEVYTPFPSFTETGFPAELIEAIETYSKRKVIGNISASGTEIIKELGEEQMRTGALIVYTSADSVLQIAAHEEVIPLEELYDICKYVRKITTERKEWMVGRIIARPYLGTNRDDFKRTTNRHDYAISPFAPTTLDYLKSSGFDVIAIGKINDIFNGQGITEAYRTKSNHEGMEITTSMLTKDFTGLCFTNLVDFDALYGHRRDVVGYGNALVEFDQQLATFLDQMTDDTLLMVVADHGNDPIHHGTDHTREYVPLIVYCKGIEGKVLLIQPNFATVGATICDNFKVQLPALGTSILNEINRKE